MASEAFAKRAGLEIVDWFYDPGVSGADVIEVRPGFSALGSPRKQRRPNSRSRGREPVCPRPSGPGAWLAPADQARRAGGQRRRFGYVIVWAIAATVAPISSARDTS